MMKLRVCGSAAMLLLFIAASLSICSAGAPSPALNKTYNVTLSQGQEVPPVPAGTPPSSGYALINFIGDKVNYKIYVYNATEVTLGHLHNAPSGVAGQLVTFLYPVGGTGPADPPSGSVTNGLLAEGTLTDASLVNSMANQTIYDLYKLAAQNELYVNIHTRQVPTWLGPDNRAKFMEVDYDVGVVLRRPT